ncbi:MAG: hypothetical protein M3441_08925 [Chloroflexota bacterium]|nr:hypothetical protein [Chloroflexota bacterium]
MDDVIHHSKLNIQNSLPPCPVCSANMMVAYRSEAVLNNLVWTCRACGAAFIYNAEYQLVPYHLELYIPACPTCGSDMIALGSSSEKAPQAGIGTDWSCKACGEVINI